MGFNSSSLRSTTVCLVLDLYRQRNHELIQSCEKNRKCQMSKAAGFKRKRDADTTADEKVSKHAKIELDDKQFKEEQFFKPVQAKRNLRLDGKASVCIFDSSGKPVFWYVVSGVSARY